MAEIGLKECSVPDVSAVPGLAALGWDEGWASALAERCDPALVAARVSRVDRGLCTVMTGAAEIRAGFERGMELVVGDWVGVDPVPPAGGRARIVAVLPRRCVFRREANERGATSQAVAANIDTVFLCDALDGSLSLRHLERFLALARQSGATPVVLITKSDSVPSTVVAQAVEAVEAIAEGVSVVVVSSITGEGLAGVTPYLVPGRTVALLGLSGAGKSTLVNLLSGAETLATGAVRRDGGGRHTTTRRELVPLPQGGLLIDTPGMRALSVLSASAGVQEVFQDIEDLARLCRYPRCSHAGEQGCELAVAVSEGRLDRGRLESWLRLKAESASTEPEMARQDVADRKRRKASKVAERRTAKVQLPPRPHGTSDPDRGGPAR
ncbi:MAG TPA: ribosome small subunit-dependent GTPase A [Acidimicrobiales bacterium]|nr:ribosome small subunit-dependent GTPase A [Acidimicrobiales bacterium]